MALFGSMEELGVQLRVYDQGIDCHFRIRGRLTVERRADALGEREPAGWSEVRVGVDDVADGAAEPPSIRGLENAAGLRIDEECRGGAVHRDEQFLHVSRAELRLAAGDRDEALLAARAKEY